MNIRTFTLLGLTAATLLAGCSKMENPLARTLPDETQVLAGPSLSLPPSFELRPPLTGEADETVLRGPTAASVSGTLNTGADVWLVQQAQQKAGVVADSEIRADLAAQVVSDTALQTEKKAKAGVLQRWFGR
jgi:hypothetical protein